MIKVHTLVGFFAHSIIMKPKAQFVVIYGAKLYCSMT